MYNLEKLATQGTQNEEKHNTICVKHHYTQTTTNNINKTWALLQSTEGKDEPNIVYMWKSQLTQQHETQNPYCTFVSDKKIDTSIPASLILVAFYIYNLIYCV